MTTTHCKWKQLHYLRVPFASVPAPVPSGISKRVYRHISQDVCPWNVSFASELTEPAFGARAGLDSRDARALAREFLSMSQAEFSARFKGSAMKRAKRRGLARNAAVVLGNVGTVDDARTRARPLVRYSR